MSTVNNTTDSSAATAVPSYGSSGCTSSGCNSSVTQTQYYGSGGNSSSQIESDGTAKANSNAFYTNGTLDTSCKTSSDFYNGKVNSCNQAGVRTFTTNDPIYLTAKDAAQNATADASQSCSTQNVCVSWQAVYNTYTCQKSAVETIQGTCSITTTGQLNYQDCAFTSGAPSTVSTNDMPADCNGCTTTAYIRVGDSCSTYSSTSSISGVFWITNYSNSSSLNFSLPYSSDDGKWHYIGVQLAYYGPSSYNHNIHAFYKGGCTQNAVGSADSNITDACSYTFTFTEPNYDYTYTNNAINESLSGYGVYIDASGQIQGYYYDADGVLQYTTSGIITPGSVSFQFSPGRNIYTETVSDYCASANYDTTSGVCTDTGNDGQGNKTFSNAYGSYTANHSCWSYQYTTYTSSTNYTNTCATYESTSGCSNTSSSCASYDADGNCTLYNMTWQCYSGQNTCSQYTTQTVCLCTTSDGTSYCAPAAATDTTNSSTDFGLTASYLSMLSEVKNDFSCDSDSQATSTTCGTISTATTTCSISLFPGTSYDCRKQLTGYMNCCKDDGAFWNSMDTCSQEEKTLYSKQGDGVCKEIGTYCSSEITWPGGKVCTENKTSYCCFNSKLSRIIQEQGRPQIGKGWGSPESPDCSGFNMCEFQALDWRRIALSAYFSDIKATFNIPTITPSTSGGSKNH
ncbi:MAG: conjugal transfer protein TraN [Deltaproteobacteria bacterium]|nr:conjugal transfer protein TraN [Deltaproteobacteria bacterium]